MKTGKIVQFIIVLFISANLQFAQTGTTEYYKDKWAKLSYLYDLSDHNAARKILSEIKSVASKNKDYQQLLKAFQYEIAITDTNQNFINPYSLINQIENEIKKTSFPVNAVLQNYLAEVYTRIYGTNSNKTKDPKFDRFNSFGKSDYLKFIDSLFQVSLKDEDKLKDIPSSEYTEILFDKENINCYPSLYDILAHRLLKFYLNNENEVNNEDLFLFADSTYLMQHQQFLKLKINDTPHFSIRNKAAKLYQKLTKTYNDDKNYEALLNIELSRISTLFNWSIFLKKKTFIENTYKNLEEYYVEKTNIGALFLIKAKYYYSRNIDKKTDYVKAIEYCNKIVKYNTSKVIGLESEIIRDKILTKQLTFNLEKYNLPNKPFKMLVTYKSIKNLYLRIIKLDEKINDFLQTVNKNSQDSIFRFLTPLKSEYYHLPEFKDFQIHSAEIALPSLPFGEYKILISDTESFTGSYTIIQSFQVTNLFVSEFNRLGKKAILVTDRKNGWPVEGVIIECEDSIAVTDPNGIAELNCGKDIRYPNLKLSYKDDVVKLKNFGSYGYYNLNENYSTVYYTDRSIYRPGQTVKFKGIQTTVQNNSESKLTDKKAIELEIRNPKNEIIKKLSLPINEYGSFSGEFKIPTSGSTGRYSIGDRNRNISFDVEEYKRPTFDIKFEEKEAEYSFGDSVKIKGYVKSFSGNSLQNSKVKYKIERYFHFEDEIYNEMKTFKDTANIGTTFVKPDGSFTISFLAGYKYSEYVKRIDYSVEAEVSDLTGETKNARSNLRIEKNKTSDNFSIELPEIVKKNDIIPPITIRSLKGLTNLKIERLEGMKSPIRKNLWENPDTIIYSKEFLINNFPYDPYLSLDYDKKAVETVLDTTLKNEFDFVNFPKNKNLPSGQYLITAKRSGETNKEFKKTVFYINPENKIDSAKMFLWSYNLTPLVENGETARVLVGSSITDIKVFCSIYDKTRLIKQEWISLTGYKQTISFPIYDEIKLPLTFHFFTSFGNQGITTKETILPKQNKQKVLFSLETFWNILSPGANETWKIKLLDWENKPLKAEVLAGLYDASLDELNRYYFYKQDWSKNPFPENMFDIWFNSINNNSISGYSNSPNYHLRDYDEYLDKKNYHLKYPAFRFFFEKGYMFSDLKKLYPVDFGFAVKGKNKDFLDNGKTSIDGIVTDVTTGTPLFGANVFLKGLSIGAATDIEGKFRIKDISPGFYTLAVRYIGYQEKEIPVEMDIIDDMFIEIELIAEVIGGYEVLVTGQSLGQNLGISRLPGVAFIDGDQILTDGIAMPNTEISEQEIDNLSTIQSRQNLQETAFFYPHIETDENGEATITFTVPEALTKWKFQSIAHTKDLKFAYKMAYAITQKTLMIKPNPPRFLRAGDTVIFSANLSNISKENLTGVASLNLIDASNDKPIDALFGNANPAIRFSADSGQTILVDWVLNVPEDFDGELIYEVKAAAGNYTDGERNSLPVLPNKFYVIETKPFVVNGNETKSITFDSFKENTSPTRQNINYSFDYTTNSFWYVIKSLPYLMEFPHECAEQMFARYYSNAVASQVLKKIPNIKNIIADKNSEIDKSALENNPKLKSTLLEETPWKVENSKNNFAVLLDSIKINYELTRIEKRLIDMSENDGGFPWFKGMNTSYYVSQHILTGFGKLRKSGFIDFNKRELKNLIINGLNYLDRNNNQHYWEQKNNNKKNKFYADEFISYLYCRSYFKDIRMNPQYDFNINEVLDSLKFDNSNSLMCNGMKAIVLSRYDKKDKALAILDSIKIRAEYDSDSSMYFSNGFEYYWYSAPIETQALILSAFKEITNDIKTVSRMQTWLIKQHKNSSWQTTKATTEAISALLMNNENWLIESTPPEIKIGNETYTSENVKNLYSDEAMGKLTLTWENKEINKSLADATVTNKNDYPGFGGLFWQYYDNYENIDTSKSNTFKIKKQIFRKSFKSTDITPLTAKDTLNQGEKVLVRLTIKSETPVDFIHIKDNRAPGFEPIDVISGMNYGGGLRYYKSTRDASTNFYIDYLPSGQYVIEFELRATHRGVFSGGITTIQSMYAPENSAHTNSPKVNIK